MRTRFSPARCCCGGPNCASVCNSAGPDNLHYTNSLLGSFVLAKYAPPNGPNNVGNNCHYYWTGTRATTPGGVLAAGTYSLSVSFTYLNSDGVGYYGISIRIGVDGSEAGRSMYGGCCAFNPLVVAGWEDLVKSWPLGLNYATSGDACEVFRSSAISPVHCAGQTWGTFSWVRTTTQNVGACAVCPNAFGNVQSRTAQLFWGSAPGDLKQITHTLTS